MSVLKGSHSGSGGTLEMSRKELVVAWVKVVVVEIREIRRAGLANGFHVSGEGSGGGGAGGGTLPFLIAWWYHLVGWGTPSIY